MELIAEEKKEMEAEQSNPGDHKDRPLASDDYDRHRERERQRGMDR
jgi:hypothetical protein